MQRQYEKLLQIVHAPQVGEAVAMAVAATVAVETAMEMAAAATVVGTEESVEMEVVVTEEEKAILVRSRC